MVDENIQQRIAALVQREHQLRQALVEGSLSKDEEHEELAAAEQELDQCWDLLRQRRAKRQYGENPDEADVRPEPQVKGYLQ